MYVITDHVNLHRENKSSDRENTGNMKMQFEWVLILHQSDLHIISAYDNHILKITLWETMDFFYSFEN